MCHRLTAYATKEHIRSKTLDLLNIVQTLVKFIVKFRINRTLYVGSVRREIEETPYQKPPAKTPNLPGDESVYLFLGFTINCGW